MKNDAPDLPDAIDITFPEPITINETPHTDFVLTRQPTGNDLGRHTFGDLLDGNIRAMAAVTPKIIQPHLSPKVIKDMSARNSMALQMGFNAFFEGVDLEGMAKPSSTETPQTAQDRKPTPTSSSAQKAD